MIVEDAMQPKGPWTGIALRRFRLSIDTVGDYGTSDSSNIFAES
jgi:hypothetical protein